MRKRTGWLANLPWRLAFTAQHAKYVRPHGGEASVADTDIKSVFDAEPDPAEEARLDAEAMADYKAGRVVPHATVVEWLKSWGTGKVLPRPTPKPR